MPEPVEPDGHWLKLSTAAEVLGMTPTGLRKRIRRHGWHEAGTAKYDAEGRLQVWVTSAQLVVSTAVPDDMATELMVLRRELERERALVDTLRRALRALQPNGDG